MKLKAGVTEKERSPDKMSGLFLLPAGEKTTGTEDNGDKERGEDT